MVRYKGFVVKPAPYPVESGYVSRGYIGKEFGSYFSQLPFSNSRIFLEKQDAIDDFVLYARALTDGYNSRLIDELR